MSVLFLILTVEQIVLSYWHVSVGRVIRDKYNHMINSLILQHLMLWEHIPMVQCAAAIKASILGSFVHHLNTQLNSVKNNFNIILHSVLN